MIRRLGFCLPFLASFLLLSGCGSPPPANETTASATAGSEEIESGQAETSRSEGSEVLVLTDETFQAAITGSEPVLVDFWAPWCGPCKMIGPVIDQMAADGAAGARYAKINVDDAPAISDKYDISSIPALLIFKDGEEVDRLIGVQPRGKIEAALRAAS